tara:strand:- start:898 stop:1191 length:294 start_codon:yes stop_codon:yes gene_type:complete
MGNWQKSLYVKQYTLGKEPERQHVENNTNLEICNCSQCVVNFLVNTSRGRLIVYNGIEDCISGYRPWYTTGSTIHKQLVKAWESEYFNGVRRKKSRG